MKLDRNYDLSEYSCPKDSHERRLGRSAVFWSLLSCQRLDPFGPMRSLPRGVRRGIRFRLCGNSGFNLRLLESAKRPNQSRFAITLCARARGLRCCGARYLLGVKLNFRTISLGTGTPFMAAGRNFQFLAASTAERCKSTCALPGNTSAFVTLPLLLIVTATSTVTDRTSVDFNSGGNRGTSW